MRRRQHIPAAGVIALTIVAVALVVPLVTVRLEDVSPKDDTSDREATISYVVHDPILIEGNTGFTNESGVVWGGGTESDPYVIEGWGINASTANGIEIRNTDAYFIVRICHVYDGMWDYYDGIHLSNCTNGTLDSNTFANNEYGIYLYWSSGNILSNNTCSDYGYGIWLELSSCNTISSNSCPIVLSSSSGNSLSNNDCSDNSGIVLGGSSGNILSNNNCSNNPEGILLHQSSGNTLDYNTCSSNDGHGIRVMLSNGNTLSNNTCSSNYEYGIFLEESSNCTLSNNRMIDDGIFIGGLARSSWNTHTILASNTVNGKSVCYLKNQSEATVPAGAGQVIIASCTSIVIRNQNLSNADCGIEMGFSSNSIADNNTCSLNSHYGIYLFCAYFNTFSNNSCSDNGWGIYLESSAVNTFSNNDCSNNGCGICLHWSSDNNMTWNRICDNRIWGVFVYYASDNNRIWENTFVGNHGAGSTYDPGRIQAYDDGANNSWNSSDGYGNHWSDWTSPDSNMDGIVDIPYNLSGTAGAKDYYPLTTAPPPIPEFSMMTFVIMFLLVTIVLTRWGRRKNTQ